MATIQLTDDLGLDADVELSSFSSLSKYFKQLPVLHGSDLSRAAGLTLDQPALKAVTSGLSFDKGVAAGPGGTAISVSAGAHGSVELVVRTPVVTTLLDVYAGDVEIEAGTCYLAFGIQAAVGAAAASTAGLLQFGAVPGASLRLRNYQRFPLQHGITILDAVKKTIGNFLIPASADDLDALPDGCVATVSGSGSLKLSGTANLLAVANPLAAVALPSPLPTVSVTAGGAVNVGASLELQCAFQICARKMASGRVQLGWYRERASDFAVSAKFSEGVSAGFGSTDLFSMIIGAISSSASTDLKELQAAKLSPGQIAAIQQAVQAAVNRKLELAVSSEIGASESSSALFLYDVDTAALSADSREALDQALRGDLSRLHAGPLPGITPVESVWDRARGNRIRLEVNLLGVLNVGMISTLTASGSVLVEPSTGALVITDNATATRIRSTSLNFGSDTRKLRRVMAEFFLFTATYQGLQGHLGGPALSCSHDFFDLDDDTSRDRMLRELRVGVALGLFSPEEAATPSGVENFGRTMIHAAAAYDSRLAQTLFLDSSGSPIPREFYDKAGRNAILLLVSDTDADAIRRAPAADDALWNRMKASGQAGFAALFPNVPAPLLGAITADYTAISWWSFAMAGAAQRLAAIGQWFRQNPAADQNNAEFRKLRQDLADHLKQVTSRTSEQFGEPWGLVAMNEASGRRAGVSILITGPRLVRARQRSVSAAASIAGTD